MLLGSSPADTQKFLISDEGYNYLLYWLKQDYTKFPADIVDKLLSKRWDRSVPPNWLEYQWNNPLDKIKLRMLLGIYWLVAYNHSSKSQASGIMLRTAKDYFSDAGKEFIELNKFTYKTQEICDLELVNAAGIDCCKNPDKLEYFKIGVIARVFFAKTPISSPHFNTRVTAGTSAQSYAGREYKKALSVKTQTAIKVPDPLYTAETATYATPARPAAAGSGVQSHNEQPAAQHPKKALEGKPTTATSAPPERKRATGRATEIDSPKPEVKKAPAAAPQSPIYSSISSQAAASSPKTETKALSKVLTKAASFSSAPAQSNQKLLTEYDAAYISEIESFIDSHSNLKTFHAEFHCRMYAFMESQYNIASGEFPLKEKNKTDKAMNVAAVAADVLAFGGAGLLNEARKDRNEDLRKKAALDIIKRYFITSAKGEQLIKMISYSFLIKYHDQICQLLASPENTLQLEEKSAQQILQELQISPDSEEKSDQTTGSSESPTEDGEEELAEDELAEEETAAEEKGEAKQTIKQKFKAALKNARNSFRKAFATKKDPIEALANALFGIIKAAIETKKLEPTPHGIQKVIMDNENSRYPHLKTIQTPNEDSEWSDLVVFRGPGIRVVESLDKSTDRFYLLPNLDFLIYTTLDDLTLPPFMLLILEYLNNDIKSKPKGYCVNADLTGFRLGTHAEAKELGLADGTKFYSEIFTKRYPPTLSSNRGVQVSVPSKSQTQEMRLKDLEEREKALLARQEAFEATIRTNTAELQRLFSLLKSPSAQLAIEQPATALQLDTVSHHELSL